MTSDALNKSVKDSVANFYPSPCVIISENQSEQMAFVLLKAGWPKTRIRSRTIPTETKKISRPDSTKKPSP